ncbi:MAG: nucleotidyltransferase family protein [Thermomicrobiales bacterium]
MGIEELLRERREEILQIAERHGARNVRVFGSVARGEADEKSDIDFLVEMERGRSLFDHVALIRDLEHTLAMRVDVATVGGLKERMRDRVLREAILL